MKNLVKAMKDKGGYFIKELEIYLCKKLTDRMNV